MAAYAALVSLTNTIAMEQIPRPLISHQISIDGGLIEALQERVDFLVQFLEEGWKGSKGLEDWIAAAAHGAEDAIESSVVGKFLAYTSQTEEEGSILLREALEKAIEDFDCIKDEAMEIKEKSEIKDVHGSSSTFVGSSQGGNNTIVGFEHEKIRIMEELTSRSRPSRVAVPIVGMGGIGKTTLARNVFDDKLIVQYFDIRAWITVSQEYNLREILMGVLYSDGPGNTTSKSFQEFTNEMNKKSEETLQELAHQRLSGRRYLIVMDDVWDADVWYKIKRFFPDNGNGSRVVVTTRLSDVANEVGTSSHKMNFLGEDSSWDLLRDRVFGQGSCPTELESIGKTIAKSCRGLPLAIVVIGGLLAKSEMTLEYWEHVAEDVSSAISLESDEENYLDVLYLSYDRLPAHLKPCFLYMGVFQEDQEIRVAELTKLWVSEGFLKPTEGKIMEDIAAEYFEDLFERNLVLVSKRGSRGKIKSFHIHDSLRDLCLREAKKEEFFCIMKTDELELVEEDMSIQRRIVVNKGEFFYQFEEYELLRSASCARSLLCNAEDILPRPEFPLLRILTVIDKYAFKPNEDADKYPVEDIFRLANSRYLAFKPCWSRNMSSTFSVSYLRNVQTIVVSGAWTFYAPSEIWRLPLLRHIRFKSIHLPDPSFMDNRAVLEHLQTLMNVENFICSDEIVRKVRNIRKLKIRYNDISRGRCKDWSSYRANNLVHLENLESLSLHFPRYNPRVKRDSVLNHLAFPQSLVKLTLDGCGLRWEDMSIIGSLPNLEVLKLEVNSFEGNEWNPVEGEFLRLKFLMINGCDELKQWNADYTHFPRLEQLVLRFVCLDEIPLEIGEIASLRLIQLEGCSESSVFSAKNLLDEQESLGNYSLRINVIVLVRAMEHGTKVESSASENFHVQISQDLRCF
ncbi:putative late blight resistance protein homolog R1B-17 [Andrographis paniculata]|uniref:putative late blight resistance protein homolog R1B-17 n=1 Tax=Andrographis paniculata TaxID=175694 RepID=UPI0021E71AE0|nr:putative late blight resistance protein homolog R1B-17 [Andrographis paniculata]XP_051115979.1 putative late blight resistance protein homolog R1B-17 [Andrographis paniculata]XP_051115980.1 putative late blight resistance protein homolog R1B-17 [Andrographis paniculata]